MRPKGDLAQGKLGDQAEDMAEKLGFRDILPEGLRSHKPGEVARLGSSIDLEWDHTGRLYELKMCNTDASEYRMKAKKSEKDAKLKFARRHKAKAYTMIAVRDADKNEIHFYAAKKPGLTGAAVGEENFDFVGTIRF